MCILLGGVGDLRCSVFASPDLDDFDDERDRERDDRDDEYDDLLESDDDDGDEDDDDDEDLELDDDLDDDLDLLDDLSRRLLLDELRAIVIYNQDLEVVCFSDSELLV